MRDREKSFCDGATAKEIVDLHQSSFVNSACRCREWARDAVTLSVRQTHHAKKDRCYFPSLKTDWSTLRAPKAFFVRTQRGARSPSRTKTTHGHWTDTHVSLHGVSRHFFLNPNEIQHAASNACCSRVQTACGALERDYPHACRLLVDHLLGRISSLESKTAIVKILCLGLSICRKCPSIFLCF